MIKDQSILIENICNTVLRRDEGEKPVSFKLKKERLYNICKEKNITSNLKQTIIEILFLYYYENIRIKDNDWRLKLYLND